VNQFDLAGFYAERENGVEQGGSKKGVQKYTDLSGFEKRANRFILQYLACDFREISVRTFVGLLERHSKQNNLLSTLNFSDNHPVDYASKLLLVTLLKHLNLILPLFAIIDKGQWLRPFPSCVHQALLFYLNSYN